jgi:hypothetical protein
MKDNKGTYYKALLLLGVFSLNTLVSFACSFSIYFHSFHHHNSPSPASEGQAEKGHPHHGVDSKHDHSHGHDAHQHGNGTEHHSPDKEIPKDDCCSSSTVQVEKLEKSVSRSIEAPNAVFLTLFLTVYASLYLPELPVNSTSIPSYIRWRFPATIQNLRIVIQSFQI